MAPNRTSRMLFRRLAGSERGDMTVTFALALVPLLLSAGAAIDYLRLANTETKLQNALDSAALAAAAAGSLSTADRVKAGEASLARNAAVGGLDASQLTYNFVVNGKSISATASIPVTPSFLQLAGFGASTVGAHTEISLPEGKKAEIALVLDYSNSMNEVVGGQVKYIAMKNAAKKLIGDLAASNPKNIKAGLVPFSHHVRATLPAAYVLGGGAAASWTGCTQDRPYPANLSDATPTGSKATKWGQPQAPVHAAWGCQGYVDHHLQVMPLTSDLAALKGQLDLMTPYAWTHIALGAEFGYHLLSPNAPFSEGVDYADGKTRKVMILLTDGEQTEPGFGPAGRTVAQGEKNLEQICTNAKASGITIMTIAYNLNDTDTRKRLRGCASDPAKNFFVADDGSQVSAAFEEIKTQIAAHIFISK